MTPTTASLPLLFAQSPFREDATSRERASLEVTGHMREQPVVNAESAAAYNALAWFWLITMLVGLLVMGVVALRRSSAVRRNDGPHSILR